MVTIDYTETARHQANASSFLAYSKLYALLPRNNMVIN